MQRGTKIKTDVQYLDICLWIYLMIKHAMELNFHTAKTKSIITVSLISEPTCNWYKNVPPNKIKTTLSIQLTTYTQTILGPHIKSSKNEPQKDTSLLPTIKIWNWNVPEGLFYELAANCHNRSTQGNSPNHYATFLPSTRKYLVGLQNFWHT